MSICLPDLAPTRMHATEHSCPHARTASRKPATRAHLRACIRHPPMYSHGHMNARIDTNVRMHRIHQDTHAPLMHSAPRMLLLSAFYFCTKAGILRRLGCNVCSSRYTPSKSLFGRLHAQPTKCKLSRDPRRPGIQGIGQGSTARASGLQTRALAKPAA